MYSNSKSNDRKRVILASGSPRRKELMEQIGYPFEVVVSDTDESFDPKWSPEKIACILAERKARAIADSLKLTDDHLIVLAADTIVIASDKKPSKPVILNKPFDKNEAGNMIRLLSGRSHSVVTGHCLLIRNENEISTVCEPIKTTVNFRHITEEEIEEYVSSDEPYDKAGGYGIQGKAACFVASIHGDYYNVMGLSVCWVAQNLLRIFNPPS